MAFTTFTATGAQLAQRADFVLANVTVRPSVRTLEGPAGAVTLEPKVMQVLLAFVDAGDAVLTRDDLVRECWDGRIVGNDAVNRTIAELRRTARECGAGFTIETIPRIGFRLDRGSGPERGPDPPANGRKANVTTRRAAMAATVGGLAIAASAPLWLRWESDAAPAGTLVEKGRRALYNGFPDSGPVASAFLSRAVTGAPRDAEAWGLLAYAYREIAEGAEPEQVSTAIQASKEAAQRALAIDPRQGDALAALATLKPYFGEFAEGEDRLREVLAVAPDNFLAHIHLVPLLQGVGLTSLSAHWNDRAGRIDPHSPVPQYRHAIRLWTWGQLDAADQAIERTIQLWPRHPGVWNARMMMFASTDRAEAGLAFLAEERSRPVSLKRPGLELWRLSLEALSSRAPADVDAARLANIRAAPRSPGFANTAMHNLAMLGDLDSAFDVAFGYYLRRGPLVTNRWEGAGEMPISALRWRRTMALFVPPAAPLRSDPRFGELAEGMGLAQYWRERRVRPDYQLSVA